jgi:hypothetical protein
VALIAAPVATASPASAAVHAWVPDGHFKGNELMFLDDVHTQSPRASARYSDRYLVNAGYYACQRKDVRRLRWQVGKARIRVVAAVVGDVNRKFFRGRQAGLARDITDSTSSPFVKVLC